MVELREIDPRILIENPDNPRRKAPTDEADKQMEATARAIGILQPPVAREVPKGLMTIYGHRRVRGAIAAALGTIQVLVLGPDEDASDDRLRALVENVARKAMTPVDMWRAVEKLTSDKWTEEAIATALAAPVRLVRKLKLLGTVHPPMLERMNAGDMPKENVLRHIASATADEQAAAWKKNRPKKGEAVAWEHLAEVLMRRTMRAADAQFDAEFAAAYGVTYTDDLFAPADEDTSTTTNVEGFLAAQHAWTETHLPEGAVLLQTEQNNIILPQGAHRTYWVSNNPGVTPGVYVDERTGKVETIHFMVPQKVDRPDRGGEDTSPAPKARGPITGTGTCLIGNMRTDALHATLQTGPIDGVQLIGLLVLALAGKNVEVKTGLPNAGHSAATRHDIAAPLIEGGVLTTDMGLLSEAARNMLAYTLSCRDNWSCSGEVALIAGDAIAADAQLPTMATQEFLMCLSKTEMSRVAADLGVTVQPTAKATRARMIDLIGDGRWVYPPALFSAGSAEASQEQRRGASLDEPTTDDPEAVLNNEGSREEPGASEDGVPEDETLDDDAGDPAVPPAAWIAPPGANGTAAAA